MKSQKGITKIYLLILIAFILIGFYFYLKNSSENKKESYNPQSSENKFTVKSNQLNLPKLNDWVLIPKWAKNNQTKFALYDFENLKEIPLNGQESFSYHFDVRYSESKNKVFIIDNDLSKIVYYDLEKGTENLLATNVYFPFGFQADFIVSPKEDMIAFSKRILGVGFESIGVIRLTGEILTYIPNPGQGYLEPKEFNQDSSEITLRTYDCKCNWGDYKTYSYNFNSKKLTEVGKGVKENKIPDTDKNGNIISYKFTEEKYVALDSKEDSYYLFNGRDKIKLISRKGFDQRVITTYYHFTDDGKSFIFQIVAIGYDKVKEYPNDIEGIYKINLDGSNLKKLPKNTPTEWY